MGILYNSDLDRIQLDRFKEAARLRGTSVLFFETKSELKDIYTDIDVVSSLKGKPVDVLIETFPQNRRTLQKVGWYNKDKEEENPITMFVPLDLEILKLWQKILVPDNVSNEYYMWRAYQVTKISTRMVYPSFWLVAIAPIFTDNSPVLNRENDFNFINVD